jgi:hypothetical protein
MSYDSAREHLARASVTSKDSSCEALEDLISAVEALTDALEKDLTQVKIALGHMARQVEALH